MGAPIFIMALYELDNPHPYTIQTVKSDMDQQSESNDPETTVWLLFLER
jgi:hypothetical protein